MALELFSSSTLFNDQSVSKRGYYMSRKLLYISLIVIAAVFAAVILGLVFGFKDKYENACVKSSDLEIFDHCVDFLCSNLTTLQGKSC